MNTVGIEAILYRTIFSSEHELTYNLVFCKAGNEFFVVISHETSHIGIRALLLKVTAVWHEKAGEVKNKTLDNNDFGKDS